MRWRVSVYMRRIAYCSPINPVPSGISDYSEELLPYLSQYAEITVYHDSSSAPSNRQLMHHMPVRPLNQLIGDHHRHAYDTVIYHMGNSAAHSEIYSVAQQLPGVVVLHDLVLHHFMLQYYANIIKDLGAYHQLVTQHYGQAGAAVAARMMRGIFDDAVFGMPLCQPVLAHATAVISHSHYVADAVQRIAPHLPIHVVPMGVPILPMRDVTALRHQLGFGDDAFIMASFGHVNPYKRTDQILRTLRTLRRAGVNAHHIIVGSISPNVPHQRMIMRTNTQDAVHITGYVAADVFNAYVDVADVCINLRHPTAGETSASLLRLLAAGKPTFITASGSFLEIPRDVAVHVPLDAHEVDFLAAALFLCYQHREFAAQVGDNARAFVQAQHTLPQSAAAYMQVLATLHGWEPPTPILPVGWDVHPASDAPLPQLAPQRITPTTRAPLPLAHQPPALSGAGARIQAVAEQLFRKQ